MYDVIVIGSATRDIFLRADGFELRKHPDSPTGMEQCFPYGSKIEVKEIVFTSGGGGTNAAVTFGRQGFKTACAGIVGKDLEGEEILKELKAEGIDTKFFTKHADDHTAYSTILVYPSGERTILSYKGEGQHFDINAVPVSEFKAKWLYIDSLGGHYDLFEALVNHAVKNNIKIACNPGGKELAYGFEKLKPLLRHIDIFGVNEEEAAGLVGTKIEEQEETLRRLSACCGGIIILTNGHDGSRVLAGGKLYTAGVPESPIIERTGAGDAFNSGFVSEYMRQMSDPSASSGQVIKKSIQFATANAASVVAKVGSKAGILKKDDWGPWPLVEVSEKENPNL